MHIINRLIGFAALALCIAFVSCDMRSEAAKRIESIPNLVTYWDFSAEDYLVGQGPESPILQGYADCLPKLINDGPLSGHSLHFDGNDYLFIPYEQTDAREG